MIRLSALMRLFARKPGLPASGLPPSGRARICDLPADAGPLYAIGDVHGCRALLAALQRQIRDDAGAFPGRPLLILLGDVVDRGPDTAGVIQDLLTPLPWADCLVLRGNHEAMMAAFLDRPARPRSWLGHGGIETLRSYGVTHPPDALHAMSTRRLHQILTAHIPDAHAEWLATLPDAAMVRQGGRDWALAHAGWDTQSSPADQSPRTLVWGGAMPAPGTSPGLIHGHFAVDQPSLQPHRIALDTGAVVTGRLTALRLAPGHPPALLHHTGPALSNAPAGRRSSSSPKDAA